MDVIHTYVYVGLLRLASVGSGVSIYVTSMAKAKAEAKTSERTSE